MIKLKRGLPRNNRKYDLPDVLLEGNRIYLCPPSINDWKEWVNIRRVNKTFLQAFEPKWSTNYNERDYFLKRLNAQKTEWDAGRGMFFFIHHGESHKVIGGINLNNIVMGAACHASLGYWLDEASQGQGYMRESLALIIDYSFRELRLRRLNAACLPDNQRSIRLLEGLGFEEEGYAKKYLQINGAWQDHRLFGLVNSA